LTLALSSLSPSPRLASAQLFGFLALSAVAAQLLATFTRTQTWQLLSLNANLDQVASGLFAQVPKHDLPVWMALAALGVLAVGGVFLLRHRIRPIEVVGGS
jgi:O-antigen/teichoic acid export membrane protein